VQTGRQDAGGDGSRGKQPQSAIGVHGSRPPKDGGGPVHRFQNSAAYTMKPPWRRMNFLARPAAALAASPELGAVVDRPNRGHYAFCRLNLNNLKRKQFTSN